MLTCCVSIFSLHRESRYDLGRQTSTFSGGVLSQLVPEQLQGKTHTKASKNHNNVVSEERLAHIRTIVVSFGGKLTYATMELHQ
jgi:hypothetical protein